MIEKLTVIEDRWWYKEDYKLIRLSSSRIFSKYCQIAKKTNIYSKISIPSFKVQGFHTAHSNILSHTQQLRLQIHVQYITNKINEQTKYDDNYLLFSSVIIVTSDVSYLRESHDARSHLAVRSVLWFGA